MEPFGAPAAAGAFVPATHFSEPVGPVGAALIVLFCLGIGGLIAMVGAGYVKTYNRMRKTDPVEIRRLGDPGGEVELQGTVRVHEAAIRSPFTDTECVAHDWTVQRYGGGGEGSNWSTLDSGHTEGRFLLDDGTGEVLVDPEGATVEMLTEEEIEVGPDEHPPPAVDTYLAETDAVDREQSHKRRYREQRIDVGEEVHVFGPVRRTGHSVDLPGGVDAVVGLDDPNRGFTVGEDDLSDLIDQVRGGDDHDRFTVTTGDERETERHMLRKGLLLVVFGAVFGLAPLAMVVLL